jgi:hypothetical protein
MTGETKPIFLLGVGAQKCGTSWLAEQLVGHPQFLMSPIKEIHYWDRRFHPDFFGDSKLQAKIVQDMKKTPDETLNSPMLEHHLMSRHELYYKTFFETRLEPSHRAFGEFSPSYCILSEDEFRYIRTFMQPYRTRALFLMREPVSRLWSQCKMEFLKSRNRGKSFDPHKTFANRFDKPTFLRRSDYKSTIESLDRAFPEEARHYAFFEELFESETLRKICDFLEIDSYDFDVSANPNEGVALDKPDRETWNRVREAYAPTYEFVERRMGYLPAKWTA